MTGNREEIERIGAMMREAGLSATFVAQVVELASESKGVQDLVYLWAEAGEAGDDGERHELVEDIKEAIADRLPGIPLQPGELKSWVRGELPAKRAAEIAEVVELSASVRRQVDRIRARITAGEASSPNVSSRRP